MKRRKQILAAVLAAITLSQGMATFAKPVTNEPKPGSDEHTTIGIAESATDLSQTSFEVPLYVTTAAISNKADLLCPDGYDIKNSATGVAAPAIGVVSMTVERIGDWNTVSTDPTGSNRDVKLVLGDYVLPELDRSNTKKTVTFLNDKPETCVFYDKASGKLTKIEAGKTISEVKTGKAPTSPDYKGITITGKVSSMVRTNKKAAAQFKVTYVVSPLDDDGNPIGNTYVGDSKPASGMQ